MEVTIGKQSIDGKMNVIVRMHDEIDGKGFDIDMSVWVDDADSRAEALQPGSQCRNRSTKGRYIDASEQRSLTINLNIYFFDYSTPF